MAHALLRGEAGQAQAALLRCLVHTWWSMPSSHEDSDVGLFSLSSLWLQGYFLAVKEHSCRWIHRVPGALYKIVIGSDPSPGHILGRFQKKHIHSHDIISLSFFFFPPHKNFLLVSFFPLIYWFHMLCCWLYPSFQWDSVGFKSFGAIPCFVASTKKGDYKVIQVFPQKVNLLQAFSSFFPSVFLSSSFLSHCHFQHLLFPLRSVLTSSIP